MNEERTVHDSSGPESPRARPTKNKRRPRFIRKVICQVCGDDANDHEHYGGVACYACKVMIFREVNSQMPIAKVRFL